MCACMYVCMYVCVFACMYVCLHVCMYVCVYVCMHACLVGCDHFQKWSQHMSCRLARHHSQMLTLTARNTCLVGWRVTTPKCLHLLRFAASPFKNAYIYYGLARHDSRMGTFTVFLCASRFKNAYIYCGLARYDSKMLAFTMVWYDTSSKRLRFLRFCYGTIRFVYISIVLH